MAFFQWFDLEFDVDVKTNNGLRVLHYIYDDINVWIEDIRTGELPAKECKVGRVYLNSVRLFVDTLGELMCLFGLC